MYSTTSPLGPDARAEALRRLADEQLDVLVIGAGVTGAGSALDAVTRGLRVGMVEARDFAAGTSSRSSKLFHGGLRYLEQLNFSLVFEALKERSLALTKLAPHLAKPVPFLYPLTRPGIDRGYAGLGIGVYDVMGAGRGVPSHLRHLGRRKTMESFPSAKAIVAGHNAQYVVRFDTLVNHQTSRLTITGPDKPAQELRIILHSDPKALTACAPRLPPGEYELHWRAY